MQEGGDKEADKKAEGDDGGVVQRQGSQLDG